MNELDGVHSLRIMGTPRSWGGLVFAAARFDFDEGREGKCEFPLSEAADELPGFGMILGDASDFLESAWVRGRIAAGLGFAAPLVSQFEDDYVQVDLPFIACARGQVPVPFLCSDAYDPSLCFRVGEDAALKQRLAMAFWDMLLAEPAEIAPYEHLWLDDVGGAYMRDGVAHGRYFELTADDPEDCEPGAYVQQQSFLLGIPNVCPECGGTGEESFYPAGDPCEECDGTGGHP